MPEKADFQANGLQAGIRAGGGNPSMYDSPNGGNFRGVPQERQTQPDDPDGVGGFLHQELS